MSHSASESLPPDTATSTRSPGSSILCEWMARRTCSSQWWTKCSRQNAALWRRTSMTAGPLHTRHFTRRALPGDDGADLDARRRRRA